MLLVGPRQCGKSTLARHALPDWLHLDLERPADLAAVSADIEGFFDAHPREVVIDQARRLPEVFPTLRHVIDRSRGKGRFVLLGSAGPALMRSVSETLAGRVAVLELTPFLASELKTGSHAGGRWFWGGFPPVHALRDGSARGEWLSAYVSTFLERDLPALGRGIEVVPWPEIASGSIELFQRDCCRRSGAGAWGTMKRSARAEDRQDRRAT